MENDGQRNAIDGSVVFYCRSHKLQLMTYVNSTWTEENFFVWLEHSPSSFSPFISIRKYSPSRQHRQERQAAERQHIAEQAQVDENHVTDIVVEETATEGNVEAETIE